MGKLLSAILSVVLILAFIGILVYLLIAFGTLVLSGKILWMAFLVLLAAGAIALIRRVIKSR